MKITKFTVTAPDGTEYHVKIRESSDTFDPDERYAKVMLYLPCRLCGYRRVYSAVYYEHEYPRKYAARYPDYIMLASSAWSDYEIDRDMRPNVRRKLSHEQRMRHSALSQIAQWDGRITR